MMVFLGLEVSGSDVVVIWILSALTGAVVGQRKDFALGGFALGMLLGIVGVLIAALVDNRVACPDCKSPQHLGAKICWACGFGRAKKHAPAAEPWPVQPPPISSRPMSDEDALKLMR